jgi:hypothetical protein
VRRNRHATESALAKKVQILRCLHSQYKLSVVFQPSAIKMQESITTTKYDREKGSSDQTVAVGEVECETRKIPKRIGSIPS